MRSLLMILLMTLFACGAAPCDQPPSTSDAAPAARAATTDGKTLALPSGETCDGTTGLTAPLVAQMPLTVPLCQTTVTNHPQFTDAPAMQWTDTVTGESRAACAWDPTPSVKLPLVVFIHGSGRSATDVYNRTLLRAKSQSYSLNPAAPGFIIVADQGRYLVDLNNGTVDTRRDIWRRQSDNGDWRNTDRLIDLFVSNGEADPNWIFVVGTSNGGFFAQEYGTVRAATPTPGGNFVAAVGVYAAADPWETVDGNPSPSCAYSPLPQTKLPVVSLHRACDALVGCNAAQQSEFGLPPGYAVKPWLSTLMTTCGDPSVTEYLFNGVGVTVSGCAATTNCTQSQGTTNHQNWPDGINDGSGNDWEPQLLTFLAGHHR